MRKAGKILFKSLVIPFYKENAALFMFLLIIMFFIVNEPLLYHYSLIIGTLQSFIILSLVFLIWLLYARKFVGYVAARIAEPQYTFLQVFNSIDKSSRYRLFFMLEVWLFLPVLIYAVCMVGAGLWLKLYIPVVLIIAFLLLICTAATYLHVQLLQNPYKDKKLFWERIITGKKNQSNYLVIILGYIANHQKLAWLGIKIFTCGILYLVTRNNSLSDYEFKPAFLFFSFGIFAHSVIVLMIRQFEETYLSFYNGLPVTALKRFCQYCLLYGILLIPELITIGLLMPVYLHAIDALGFALSSFSLVLLMNSITFEQDLNTKEYFKVIFMLFFIQFILLLSIGLLLSSLLFFIIAVLLFLPDYFRFQRLN